MITLIGLVLDIIGFCFLIAEFRTTQRSHFLLRFIDERTRKPVSGSKSGSNVQEVHPKSISPNDAAEVKTHMKDISERSRGRLFYLGSVLIISGFLLQALGAYSGKPETLVAPTTFSIDGERPVTVSVDEHGGVTVLWAEPNQPPQ